MNLLYEINIQAQQLISKNEKIDKNVELLEKYLAISTKQLNETVTNWLAGVLNVISKGDIDPTKKDEVIKILGALQAVSNPDLADALDEKGNLATILQRMGDRDKETSNAGLHSMAQLGNNPSVKSFVDNARNALNDNATATQYIKKIQSNIDQVMRRRLFKQQSAAK